MSCPHKWKTGNGRSVWLHDMETDHLQNLARWLVRSLDEYQRVKTYAYGELPKYRVRGRLGTEWLKDVLNELKERV